MIVDASVAFKWIAREDDSDIAIELLTTTDVLAPTLLLIEVGNGLWKKAVKEQIDSSISFSDEVRNMAQMLTIVDESDHVPRALELARELEHPIYDCVYLSMAEGLGDQLVTADTKFFAKLAPTPFAHLVKLLSDLAA